MLNGNIIYYFEPEETGVNLLGVNKVLGGGSHTQIKQEFKVLDANNICCFEQGFKIRVSMGAGGISPLEKKLRLLSVEWQ